MIRTTDGSTASIKSARLSNGSARLLEIPVRSDVVTLEGEVTLESVASVGLDVFSDVADVVWIVPPGSRFAGETAEPLDARVLEVAPLSPAVGIRVGAADATAFSSALSIRDGGTAEADPDSAGDVVG